MNPDDFPRPFDLSEMVTLPDIYERMGETLVQIEVEMGKFKEKPGFYARSRVFGNAIEWEGLDAGELLREIAVDLARMNKPGVFRIAVRVRPFDDLHRPIDVTG